MAQKDILKFISPAQRSLSLPNIQVLHDGESSSDRQLEGRRSLEMTKRSSTVGTGQAMRSGTPEDVPTAARVSLEC